MNTPKTLKRHQITITEFQGVPSGRYVPTLNSDLYALHLARIVAEFEHLESHMAIVLGVLLGANDEHTAGYVLRSLRAPRIRQDLMKSLLCLAPVNKTRDQEYDAIIDEFSRIAKKRNTFVHGRWYTNADDPTIVVLVEHDEHGLGLLNGRLPDVKELVLVREAISALITRIYLVPGHELDGLPLPKP